MSPAEATNRLLAVPYVPGGGSWAGADCWGVVELWYRHVLGIELADRADLPPGNASLHDWAETSPGWTRIQVPVDHCLVLMRVGALNAGHVGIHYQGSVLHTASRHGCVLQPLSDRTIRSRISGFLSRP